MAKIIQEKLTITLSKLVKDSDEDSYIMNEELISDLDKALNEIGNSFDILIELGGD